MGIKCFNCHLLLFLIRFLFSASVVAIACIAAGRKFIANKFIALAAGPPLSHSPPKNPLKSPLQNPSPVRQLENMRQRIGSKNGKSPKVVEFPAAAACENERSHPFCLSHAY